ncbi:MAG: asparagine synthase (glutamine-hydrolyzing), partial [Acidobacteriota bacterium]|nr:asparagine synthase (glutamine-hydrolyzing) [Acidobacteriota bacterium]
MCGIAGLLCTDGMPAPRPIVDGMTAALAHRGPDGSGVTLRGAAGLGHRRLAIIDPASGAQPLSNEDGRLWITFNGEIYNYRDLRTDLEAHGHRFRTQSDTEVVVHAYEQWGAAAVPRLRGMFAFGIVDERDGHLFLARDPLGIKPLYYAQTPTLTAFASELQALRPVPGLDWTLDIRAIDQYLRLQYIPAPRTVYAHVRKLPPAHTLRIEFDGHTQGPREYWQIRFQPEFRRTEREWLDALDEVLRRSVRAHLVADVPFGAFLSGGLDSSAVVAYMAQELDAPVETFSIGFEEQDFTELHYAEQAARRWQTHHHAEIVRADCLELLPALVRHYGEPFGDSSALPTFLVSRMARGAVPMVLSGDGGDEAFGGYNDYGTWRRWLRQDDQPIWKQHGFPSRPTLETWLTLKQQTAPETRCALWRPELRAVTNQPIATLEEAWRRARGATPV